MRIQVTVQLRSGIRRDMVIEAAASDLVRDVFADYARDGDDIYLDAGQPLPPDVTLAQSGITHGQVVSMGTPIETTLWPLTTTCLLVHSGTQAGKIIALQAGTQTLGRAPECTIRLDDESVSASHAKLTVTDGGIKLADLTSRNGTWLFPSTQVDSKAVLVPFGEPFRLGRCVCSVVQPTRPDGVVGPVDEGERPFNRVSRYQTPIEPVRISWPAEDDTPSGAGTRVLQGLAGIIMAGAGVTYSIISGNWMWAAIGAVGPVLMVVMLIVSERSARTSTKRRQRKASSAMASAQEERQATLDAEVEIRLSQTLDPARARLAAMGPTRDLWSADVADVNALTMRVGIADLDSQVEIQEGRGNRKEPLFAVPFTVNLRACPVLGVTGDKEHLQASARAFIMQFLVTCSPEDVAVIHLSAATNDAWSWLRWAPHTSTLSSDLTVSSSPEALKEQLTLCAALLDQRANELVDRGPVRWLEILVLIDGAGALRSEPTVVRLLKEGPALGFRIIAIDDQLGRLPVECTARLVCFRGTATCEVKGSGTTQEIWLDEVSVDTARDTIRSLAALRPLGGAGEQTRFPSTVRLPDLTGVNVDDAAKVLGNRWENNTSRKVPLGVNVSGDAVGIDLEQQGPHALVAGTTGAGKSEFLRTWVLSQALSAPPSELSFLLIDYKGGGAFGALRELPHVVGYGDNLTLAGNLSTRLLESLQAELRYRQKCFKEAAVSDLVEYRARRHGRPQLPLLTSLVVVIDELAELKVQSPEFIDGLMQLARTGRSLGVHLILATQQPSGVVNDQIQQNMNLRVCLRVQDASVSRDIVGLPDAGYFPTQAKGRAIIAVSGDSTTTVQTAYVSAALSGGGATEPVVTPVPWNLCGRPLAKTARAEAQGANPTELQAFVQAIQAAVEGQPAVDVRRPWLEPLPPGITTDLTHPASTPTQIAFGFEDQPAEQSQVPIFFPVGQGNLGIAGGRSSGRSTSLRAIALELARQWSAEELHVYGIDQTSVPALRCLSQLPHCGMVATRLEKRRTTRLVELLTDELSRRSQLTTHYGVDSFTALRSVMGEEAPTFILLFVDGWDTIYQEAMTQDGALRDALIRLAEDGPSLGIQVVLAGGKAMSTSRIMSTFQSLVVLNFEQSEDMDAFSVPKRARQFNHPGCGYRPHKTSLLQLAQIPGGSMDAQAAHLRTMAATMPSPARHIPWSIDELPTKISSSAAARLRSQRDGEILLAVGGDQLEQITVDLLNVRTPFFVAGPTGSGRTNTLALIAQQLRAAGVDVVTANVSTEDRHLFEGTSAWSADSDVSALGDTFVLIDDAGNLADDHPLIHACLGRTSPRLVIAGEAPQLAAYRGWKAHTRGAPGILLSPSSPADNDVLMSALTYKEVFSGPVGRGLLIQGKDRQQVQIPQFDFATAPQGD